MRWIRVIHHTILLFEKRSSDRCCWLIAYCRSDRDDLDLVRYLLWKSDIRSVECLKFSIEYHVSFEGYSIHFILYWSFLYRSRCRESNMSSNSHSSSFSSTMTEGEKDCIWSDSGSFEFERSRKVWNVSWIFMKSESFSWQIWSSIRVISNESIILWFSFLNERLVLMFLIDNHIFCSMSVREFLLIILSLYQIFSCKFSNILHVMIDIYSLLLW